MHGQDYCIGTKRANFDVSLIKEFRVILICATLFGQSIGELYDSRNAYYYILVLSIHELCALNTVTTFTLA